jgi:alcohol dehydrogenase (cytochrome c)
MKRILIASLLTISLPTLAFAQSAADLRNAANTPDRVLTYGMSYSQQRFSTLTQINRGTVKRLVPAWAYSLDDSNKEESQALVMNGVIYITAHDKTAAINVETGREIWKTMISYPPETAMTVCCGIENRGGALYNGKFFRTILDGRVQALDIKTGKEIWNVRSSTTAEGYAMTGAPLVVNGVVIVGVAGAEFSSRGYIEGYDAETGNRLWRLYTVPRPGERGAETWPNQAANAAGGSTWTTGSYDPELDLVYWGTGNPSPHNALDRKGDNLYTDSILAIRPKTGEMVWHYQTSPNDPFDYDNVQSVILAEINSGGSQRKVLMQAARNGFLYVLDRTNGELLAANKYAKATWAERVDMATGRPVWSEETKKILDHVEKIQNWPYIGGATNWYPPSYSPLTGLMYVNSANIGVEYEPLPLEELRKLNLAAGGRSGGNTIKTTNIFPDPEPRGYLKAINPTTGEAKWQTGFKSPNWAGTLVTAGGLVFTGTRTGELIAVDADTGKILWQFQTSSGIVGQPVTWQQNGIQYVTVTSGDRNNDNALRQDPNIANVPMGGSLWTFKLLAQ